MNIRTHFQQAVAGGMDAKFAIQDGSAGALFHDEGEFIPFDDLGYSPQLGYFRISNFPDERSECDNEPFFSLHPFGSREHPDWWVLALDDGTLVLLDSRDKIAELAATLNRFVETGAHDPEPISEWHPGWTTALSMKEAVDYIASRGWPRDRAADTLRRAAWEERVPGAIKNEKGTRWIFSRGGLDEWLKTALPYEVVQSGDNGKS